METVAVLGAGSIGTALAQVAATNGHRVRVWSIESEVLAEIRERHTSARYAPGIRLNDRIEACDAMPDAVAGAALVIVSVPSQAVGAVVRQAARHVEPGQAVVNVAKGLEAGTNRRMSQVLAAELPPDARDGIASMGGPAIAIEMALGHPMAVIAGSANPAAAERAQRVLQNQHLKVETTSDVAGVELCATLKNVYAIALGLCDGLGHGTNTKAFVASLALEEMAVVCVRLGAKRKTVYGLAGLGDLLTTGFSEHSRNRTLGEKLGAGSDWQEFLRAQTVEGVAACRAMAELTRARGIRTLLLDTIRGVLCDKWPAAEAMRAFFRQFAYG
jgi:glycerol-3-phosphate dehydrogenase (NAD(P)+)